MFVAEQGFDSPMLHQITKCRTQIRKWTVRTSDKLKGQLMRLSFSHVKKEELPVREFQKSCADLITESFVTIIGVFEQNQTTVAGKSAFSGEVERVSEGIEQVPICQFFFINTGSDDPDGLTKELKQICVRREGV